MNLIYKYMRKYKLYIFIAIMSSSLAVICEMFLPTVMSNVIDFGIAQNNFKKIIYLGLIMILLSLVGALLGCISIYYSSIISQKSTGDLRQDIFSHVQKFSLINLDKFSTASLITRLTSDINNLNMTLMMALRLFIRAPITLIFTCVMIMLIDFNLSLIVLGVIIIFIFIIYIISKISMPRFTALQIAIDKINLSMQEKLINIRLIKSLGRENFEQERFNSVAQELRDKTIRAFDIALLIMPILVFILNLTNLSIWWYGGQKFLNNKLAIGKLVAFTSYVFLILFSILMISFVILMIIRASSSLARIKEILNEKINLLNINIKNHERLFVKSLEFKNIKFKYNQDDEKFILENINFKINSGELVGIVGATSSGKSSLVNLIPRLYEINSGEILINNKNICDYDLDTLRNAIGFVFQENILFSGSIKNNIKLGVINSHDKNLDKKIIHACKTAQADEFINLMPDKYQTRLEQMGVNISGGQKQRLCIARALVRTPEILILDDATSALDAITENKIYQSFQNELKNAIKIIISQKISSIKYCDKIIILDSGKVSGIGTHDKLLNTNEIYKSICESQNQS